MHWYTPTSACSDGLLFVTNFSAEQAFQKKTKIIRHNGKMEINSPHENFKFVETSIDQSHNESCVCIYERNWSICIYERDWGGVVDILFKQRFSLVFMWNSQHFPIRLWIVRTC